MSALPARDRFLTLLREAFAKRSVDTLTLSKPRDATSGLRSLRARPVELKAGPRLSLVWRHATLDTTENLTWEEALPRFESLIGADFLHAHLFSEGRVAQFEADSGPEGKLRMAAAPAAPARPVLHDRVKPRPIDPASPWLRGLGVTSEAGRPREAMASKFRQIERFAEILGPLISEAGLSERPVSVFDMGSGKGYLTFAVRALLGPGATVTGIERRADLVSHCNQVAANQGWAPGLSFRAGSIADTPVERCDVLIALHACDTATDDALAAGVRAEASLIVAAPCCQKELRPKIRAPEVLEPAFRHGIFLERQAEFVTDALRVQLLEWAGFRARAFEFISTEHTAKNLLICAVRASKEPDPAAGERARAFARFYGIETQRLADLLGFAL